MRRGNGTGTRRTRKVEDEHQSRMLYSNAWILMACFKCKEKEKNCNIMLREKINTEGKIHDVRNDQSHHIREEKF